LRGTAIGFKKRREEIPSRSIRSLVRYREEEAGNGKVKKAVRTKKLERRQRNAKGECIQLRWTKKGKGRPGTEEQSAILCDVVVVVSWGREEYAECFLYIRARRA
jgi:hypothetical protein